MNENMDKEIVENNVNEEVKEAFIVDDNDNNNSNNSNMRKKLMKMMLLLVGVLVIVLVIFLIVSAFSSRNLDYEVIESKMKGAAVDYYEVQKGLLPQVEGEVVSVDASVLSKNGYMKSLSELRSDASCTGKVEVSMVDGNFVYTPYLYCGDSYNTKELYKAVLEQGIVTSGDGLYEVNSEKVYRGDKVNNYVNLDNNVFRIVKVMNDNKLMLILSETDFSYSVVFDDRYNSNKLYNSGFNDYNISRINTYLNDLYNNDEDKSFLSSNDKEKLVPFNLCVGKRNEDDATKNNAVECSSVLENQMIGLLTVSDYMNASLDSNCTSTTSRACQNYNYLKLSGNDWWLGTAVASNTHQMYVVNNSGYIVLVNASSAKRARPVIMLSSKAMIKSGDGSVDNPFILK